MPANALTCDSFRFGFILCGVHMLYLCIGSARYKFGEMVSQIAKSIITFDTFEYTFLFSRTALLPQPDYNLLKLFVLMTCEYVAVWVDMYLNEQKSVNCSKGNNLNRIFGLLVVNRIVWKDFYVIW